SRSPQDVGAGGADVHGHAALLVEDHVLEGRRGRGGAGVVDGDAPEDAVVIGEQHVAARGAVGLQHAALGAAVGRRADHADAGYIAGVDVGGLDDPGAAAAGGTAAAGVHRAGDRVQG